MQNLEYAKNNLREKLRRDVSEDEFNISVDQIIEIALVEYTETLRAKAAAVHDALKDVNQSARCLPAGIR